MAGDYRSRGCFAHRSDLLLEQGKVYFSVQFADEDMLIPIMKVFAGRNLDPEDGENHLYFQDIEAYLQRIRYGSATGENATFQVALEENTKHILEYEHALEELLKCSLRQRNYLVRRVAAS